MSKVRGRSRASRSRGATPEVLESRRLLTVPAGFAETLVATGINNPTTMAVAPDGRVFVAQQNGNVRVVKNGALLPTPFVNVREDSREERGLLGLTFDPDFATNHYVYLYYTKLDAAPLVSHNVVSRFVADGDVAAGGVAAEQVLFELPDVGNAIWHMGGALRFGPDGKLYVGVGDHQQPDTAQSLSAPFGKILRINSDGTIPADNPFYNQTTGINRAIWAYGLRNPFSSAFQPGRSRLYINDVGQGWIEEIDEGAAGGNYGWPQTEGAFDPAEHPGFTNPTYAYTHDDGCAIMGGAFYDGVAPNFPRQYRGQYFFGDFCFGWVRTLDPATGTAAPFGGFPFPVAVTVGPDGSLWVLSHDSVNGRTSNDGQLRKVEYTQKPPAASVAGRWVFYNNSAFDGRDPSPNAADDAAVATDKAALLPGEPAGFANVTSYLRGINGVMVDVRGAWGQLAADDFAFDVGTGPAGAAPAWSAAPAPTSVTVRPGAGVGGADRVTLVWPDGAVRNQWLRVTVKSDDDTGLSAPDVFYFGNLIGKTAGPAADGTAITVNALDLTGVRRNLFSNSPVTITNPYDLNRDARVNALDMAAARANLSRSLPLFIAPPAGAPAAAMFVAATSLLKEES